jgi:predicted DNA-binding protein (UPF0251 family)
VRHDPDVVYFKPAGVPMRMLREIPLGLDELEALRLADVENLSHEDVGEMMNVSRATVGRILAEGRRKTALALVHGWAIRLEGGIIETVGTDGIVPPEPAEFPPVGRGRGRGWDNR